MRLNRFTATLVLLLATIIWGFAFVFQKNAMSHMGPLTFMFSRCLLGGVALLPLAIAERRRHTGAFTRGHWALMALLTVLFLIGLYLQQAGLVLTTVTNGGFLTGFYVFFVPIILMLGFRTLPHPVVWICAPLALVGLFLLNGATFDGLNAGDILVVVSAVFWAGHILLLGYLSRQTQMPVFVSCISFLAAGALALIAAFVFETPDLASLSSGWVEIAYVGIMSTAIAFTLQATAQVHLPPANTAIILSSETLFAAFGGALLLGERLPPIGYIGAVLIFAAIVLVESVPVFLRRLTVPA